MWPASIPIYSIHKLFQAQKFKELFKDFLEGFQDLC